MRVFALAFLFIACNAAAEVYGLDGYYYATGRMFYGTSVEGKQGWYIEMLDYPRTHAFWVFYAHNLKHKAKI